MRSSPCELAGCDGPFGLRAVTGSVTYTFGPATGGVRLTASAVNLQLGGGNLAINASALFSGSAGARSLAVSTDGGGIGPHGSTLARRGDYRLAWNAGDNCAVIDGAITAGNGSVQRTSVRAVRVCTTGCPQAGTVIVLNPTTGATLTTTYDGSSAATVTSSSGAQTILPLSCS